MSEQSYWTQRRFGRRRILGTTAAGAAGLAAAATIGCGDDDDAEEQAPGQESAQAPVKRGGTLKMLFSAGEYGNDDPHQEAPGSMQGGGSGLVYSQLMTKEMGNFDVSIDVKPAGDLAASWEQPDDTTYVFRMRPNAKWQNVAPVNGRVVTANDVVYSAKRQVDLKITSSYWPGVQDFTATDPQTVRIKLTKPDADFLAASTAFHNKVVAPEAVNVSGDLKNGPVVGSGPWIYRERVPNQVVRVVKNPDFYRNAPDGKPYPYADAMDVLRIADVSTYLAAFRTGQIHACSATKTDIEPMKSAVAGVQVGRWRRSGPLSGQTLILRADVAPTTDIRVREAVNKAIDRDSLIGVLQNDGWVGSETMLAATSIDQLLPEDEVRRLLPFNPQAARQLLEAAGVRDWRPLVSIYIGAAGTTQGELVQANLRQIGVNATLEIFDNVALGRWWTQRDRAFVPFIRGTSVTGVNADVFAAYKSDGVRNLARLPDPELDRLVDGQAAELKDAKRRNTLLHDMQRRAITIGGMTPLYASPRLEFYQPYLRNVWTLLSPGAWEPEIYLHMWLDQ